MTKCRMVSSEARNRLVNWNIMGIGDGLEQEQDQCWELGLADPCRPKASIRSKSANGAK
jgi:hypothetical protein